MPLGYGEPEPPQPDQRAERVAVAGGALGGDELFAGERRGGDVAEAVAHAVDRVAGGEQPVAEPGEQVGGDVHGSRI